MQINIKNIRINSISTIGSLNIGKTVFSGNTSSTARFPKPFYEENEPENAEENGEIEIIEPPFLEMPPFPT
ncbi:hypothetical protein [Bacillus alkalicellulosilyticus]|uniref:hypothetical protein n=1 Tax=Alkalihalobacterium alkalicellulosilyticum TaxID=1912214 RepID=UPI000996DF62|nr:hypothetical protein [Bacillus alkalicellulosilyticus]